MVGRGLVAAGKQVVEFEGECGDRPVRLVGPRVGQGCTPEVVAEQVAEGSGGVEVAVLKNCTPGRIIR